MSSASRIIIPDYAMNVLNALTENGFEAYAVGGCVRDALLGRTPGDWDVTTSAEPEEIKACFPGGRTIDTGIKHGTVTVLSLGVPVEVTTFRVDGTYTDARHPDKVSFTRSLREDLARRDFTMNAVALSRDGDLTDPFGGAGDIGRRLIRAVGDPEKRFGEDALRIMRAVRFASVLGFEIEKETKDAVFALKDLTEKVAAERRTAEFIKLINGQAAPEVIGLYAPVIGAALPALSPVTGDSARTAAAADTLGRISGDDADRLAAFLISFPFSDRGPQCRALLKEMKMSNRLADTAGSTLACEEKLGRGLSRSGVKRLLRDHGPDITRRALRLRAAASPCDAPFCEELETLRQSILKSGEPYLISGLAVSGRSLPTDGKLTGECLSYLLDRVIDEPELNRKKILFALADDYIAKRKKDPADID